LKFNTFSAIYLIKFNLLINLLRQQGG